MTDSHKFGVNLLRHINNIDNKSRFVINLIQQKNRLLASRTAVVACITYSSTPYSFIRRLKPIRISQISETSGKGIILFLQSYLTQADTSVAALDNFVPVGIVISSVICILSISEPR